MAIDLNILNSQLSGLTKNSNLDDILVKALPAANQAISQLQTTLTEAGVTVDGITALSQATDIPNQELGAAVDAIVEITGDVPGLSDKLIGDVSNALDSLTAITGTEPSNGKLKLTIGSGAPEAVARALKLTASVSANEVTGVLQNLAPARVADAIGKIDDTISSGISISTGFGAAAIKFNVNFNNLLGFNSGGIFTNLIRKLNIETDRILDALLSDTQVDKEEVVDLITKDKKAEAVALITDKTNLDPEEVEQTINSIDLDPSKSTAAPNNIIRTSVLPPYIVGSNESTWSGKKSAEGDFTYCDGPEELVAEMRNTSRSITKVVVHWSETYNGQDIGSEEINDWHVDSNNGGIGYHYVIRRDGRLQRGRPIGKKGYHTRAGNNDDKSIGICIVGGYNCLARTPNPRQYLSADSFTSEQMISFKMFMRSFYDVWPGGDAFGHSDLDQNARDPGFDVKQYVLSTFNKINVADIAAAVAPILDGEDEARSAPGENGRLDTRDLLQIGTNHFLREDAGRAYLKMVQAAADDGVTWTITDSYRTYETQVRLAQEKGLYSEGGLAARPGTSNHGWGLAVDLGGGANKTGTTENNWLVNNANRFGFFTIPREPWHWEYRG